MYDLGGQAYGGLFEPLPGSGGGNTPNSAGGAGGGVIHITVLRIVFFL